jgi:hypothetical protein
MMVNRREEIQRRIEMVAAKFETYLQACDLDPPFKGPDQLNLHRQTIARRRELGSVEAAVDDARFVRSLYDTLQAWDIGKRGSKPRPYSEFAEALGQRASAIAALEGLCIDDPALDAGVGNQLWELVAQLDLVENQAKLVAHSKALHHLLPELLPPIDREWTGRRFFYRHGREMQYEQEAWFWQAECFRVHCQEGAAGALRHSPGLAHVPQQAARQRLDRLLPRAPVPAGILTFAPAAASRINPPDTVCAQRRHGSSRHYKPNHRRASANHRAETDN